MANDMPPHFHPEGERQALRLRVRKVAGQLRALETMLAEDRECSDILTQLVSARRGLKSLAEKIMSMHMHNCIEHLDDPRDAKKRLRELMTVLERYVE